MSGKYSLRYLSAEEKPKAKKKGRLVWVILCIVLVLCIALLLYRHWPMGQDQTDIQVDSEATQPQMPTEEDTAPDGYRTIQTAYGTLLVSADCFEELRHVEITQDDVAMEVFYMPLESGERELFRVCFNDAGVGDQVGYLDTDAGKIPVSVAVCFYNEEDFETEELRDQYHKLMGQLDTVLTSLRSDSRYVAAEVTSESNEAHQTVELIYWNLELPASMEWEEKASGDVYQVDFYGNIGDARVLLYSIYFGEANAESVVGTYTVDGEEKTLSADTYSLEMQIPDADEQTRADYYTQMRTINDVLKVIMSSENFSEKNPEQNLKSSESGVG